MNEPHELTQQARWGDRKALHRLFEPLEQPVYAYLRRLLGNDADAQDVAQEVFLAAMGNLDQYAGRGSFKAWVFQIAHRRGLNWLRDRKKLCSEPADINELMSSESSVESNAELAELKQMVHRAVQRLSDEQQAVVWLRIQSELSFQQIAEVTGLPLGTVLSRMHQAKLKLAKILQTSNR